VLYTPSWTGKQKGKDWVTLYTLEASGAMNRCPCGYNGGPVKECKCSATEISRYQKRISGLLLDHIDIFIDLSKYPEMNMKTE